MDRIFSKLDAESKLESILEERGFDFNTRKPKEMRETRDNVGVIKGRRTKKCVVVEEKRYYTIEVEADTQEECEDIALKSFRDGMDEYDCVATKESVYNMYDNSDEVPYNELGEFQDCIRCRVDWDTDTEEEKNSLPLFVDIPFSDISPTIADEFADEIVEQLTKKTGFCVGGFGWGLV